MSANATKPIVWSAALAAAVLAAMIIGRGCGFDELSEPSRVDSTPDAGLDASTDADTSIDTRSTDRPDAPDAPDAGAYSLPADSIATCGEYFACVYDCPEHVESCVGPCHDAMTSEAAGVVQALASCINNSGCRDETCMFDECGRLLDACFNTYPAALQRPEVDQVPALLP